MWVRQRELLTRDALAMALFSRRQPVDALWNVRASGSLMGSVPRMGNMLMGQAPRGLMPSKRPSDPFPMVSATKRHGKGTDYHFGNMLLSVRYREIPSTWTILRRNDEGRVESTTVEHVPVEGEPLFSIRVGRLAKTSMSDYELSMLDELSSPCPATVMNARLEHDVRFRPQFQIQEDGMGKVDVRGTVIESIAFVGFYQTNPLPSAETPRYGEDADSKLVTVHGYCGAAMDMWPDSANAGDSIGFAVMLMDRKKLRGLGGTPRVHDSICSYANWIRDVSRRGAAEGAGQQDLLANIEDCRFQLVPIDTTVSPSNATSHSCDYNPALLPLDVLHTAGVVKAVMNEAAARRAPVRPVRQGGNEDEDGTAPEEDFVAEEEDEDGVETSVALLTWTCAYIHVGQVVYRNQKVMSIGQTRESVAQYLHAQSKDAALRAVMNIGQFNPSIAPRAPPRIL